MAHPVLRRQLLPVPIAGALLLALFSISAWLLSGLRLNNAPDTYLPSSSRAVQFYRELHKKFPGDQVLVAVFTGKNLFSEHVLRGLEQVTRHLQRDAQVERVLSVVNLDHISGTADSFVVQKLLSSKVAASLDAQQRRARVLHDRFAPGLLVSKDGSVLALVVRPRALDGSVARLHLEQDLRKAVRTAGLQPYLYGLTGNVALDVAELRSMIHDTLLFVPATTLLGLVLIWWMFRRPLALLLAIISTTVVVMSSVALFGLLGWPYTLVSAMTPPLMTALTIALLLHIFNALRHAELRGVAGPDRTLRAISDVRRPTLYTTLTTMVGLVSLSAGPIPPIVHFGLAATGACVLMYVVVIWLLPPLLAKWDRGSWARATAGGRWLDFLVRTLAHFGIRRAGWVLGVTVVGVAVAAPALWRVVAETDLYRFFPDSTPLMKTTAFVEKKLSGVTAIEVVFDGPGRDSLKDPRRLREIAKFQNWLKTVPGVDHTASMPEIVEEMNWGFHGENPKYRRIPTNEALISQYMFIYDGTELYDFVDHDFKRTQLVANLHVRGANAIGKVIRTIRHHLQTTDLGDLRWHITGFGRLFADQQKLLVTGQIDSLWVVLAMMSLFMVLVWRSLTEAVLTMLPNIAPVFVIFVVMGTLGIWLDMATAIVASVAVGIAVDDTIHIFHTYKMGRRRGLSAVAALTRSYHHSGRAVVATTVILGAQFALLTASHFRPMDNFGLLTAVGLVTGLLFDLLLLPALIVAWDKLCEMRAARRAIGAD